MQALIVVDVQNEFSPRGQRAVPGHAAALDAVTRWAAYARANGWPIAWVQHHNRPDESPAFVPGSWGAELSPGIGPRDGAESDGAESDGAESDGAESERLIVKDVFGAFSTTDLDAWLRARGVTSVVIVGFYAHMCVSTSTREALVRGYDVVLDPAATGASDLVHPTLGAQSADEVRRSAFLQLTHMGATIATTPAATADAPRTESAAAA